MGWLPAERASTDSMNSSLLCREILGRAEEGGEEEGELIADAHDLGSLSKTVACTTPNLK